MKLKVRPSSCSDNHHGDILCSIVAELQDAVQSNRVRDDMQAQPPFATSCLGRMADDTRQVSNIEDVVVTTTSLAGCPDVSWKEG